MARRSWVFENAAKNGVGFTSNGTSLWEGRRFRRASLLMTLVCVAPVLAAFGYFIVLSRQVGSASPSGPNMGALLAIFMGPFVLILVVGAYTFSIGRRATRSAERSGGYACPGCLHDLSANPVERCTECGQRVVYETLPVLWNRKHKRRFLALQGRRFDATGFDDQGTSRFESRARGLLLWLGGLAPLGFFGPTYVIQAVRPGWNTGGTVAANVGFGLLIPLLGMLFVMGPFVLEMARRQARLRRSLTNSGGMACPACLHDLSAAEVERCPKCGQHVDYQELRRSWSVRMMMLRIEGEGSRSG